MSTDAEQKVVPENWLSALFEQAGVDDKSTLADTEKAMDDLATEAAPAVRSWWVLLILAQGLAVVTPVVWLVRERPNAPAFLSTSTAALCPLIAILILVVALAWVRWRGMQRTWARARLVAEITRGLQAAADCPEPLEIHALVSVPCVRDLRVPARPNPPLPLEQWREIWIKKRANDQVKFFRKARVKAKAKRKQFTLWTTLFMDLAFALAVAGAAITWNPRGDELMRLLGGKRLEWVLGLGGMLMPLGIILLQAMRHFQELNRRITGFTNQIKMLESARTQLRKASSQQEALQIITASENQLLAEVVDWYFETEHAEQYFQVRAMRQRARAEFHRPLFAAARWKIVNKLAELGGDVLVYIYRFVLARLVWAVGAVIAALLWISYWSPNDPAARSKLGSDGRFLDEQRNPWNPDPTRAKVGCIIIVHGLHDSAQSEKEEERWMSAMASEFRGRLGAGAPNIGLVDWSKAAIPTKNNQIHIGVDLTDQLNDFAAIRGQAYEIGDYLAFRLGQYIRDNGIDRNQPLHLIGHSAGGFVVARAALELRRMNLAPDKMQVTILDTPQPAAEILKILPEQLPVDFYVSSGFVIGLNETPMAPGQPGLCIHKISTPTPLSKVAHRQAYRWFTDSIPSASPGDFGFGRSPFCLPKPAGTSGAK